MSLKYSSRGKFEFDRKEEARLAGIVYEQQLLKLNIRINEVEKENRY